MPEPTKIDLALKEIDFGEIMVTVSNGKIVKINKGRYVSPERNGVRKDIEIREDIINT